MSARLDPVRREVVVGARRLPFRLDLRNDRVSVTLGGAELAVRPLQWREKVTLARFAHLGPEFLREEVIRLCSESELPSPLESEDAEVLWELAAWMSEPPASTPVPLDSRSLASVTLRLCRAMGLKPADFDTRSAPEVEAMWEVLGQQAEEGSEEGGASFGAASSSPSSSPSSSATRIVIVPDAAPDTERHEVDARSEGRVVAVVEPAPAPAPAPVPAPARPQTPVPAPAASPRGVPAAASQSIGAIAMAAATHPVSEPGAPAPSPADVVASRDAAPGRGWRDASRSVAGTAAVPVAGQLATAPPSMHAHSKAEASLPPHPMPWSVEGQLALVATASAPMGHPEWDGGPGWAERAERAERATVAAHEEPSIAAPHDFFEELADRLEQAAAEMGIGEN